MNNYSHLYVLSYSKENEKFKYFIYYYIITDGFLALDLYE